MLAAIRIAGEPETDKDVRESLFRMRLRRKFTLILLPETKENAALLKQFRDFIAYGKIDSLTLTMLVEKRGQPIDKKKVDAKKAVELIEKKGIMESGLKPFFRLHPPRKGIDSKIHFGRKKGVLGDNGEKINDLIRRML